jgi:hypothetical protein
MMMLPTKVDASLKKFHRELCAWLDAGGDQRLKEFGPLGSWQAALKELAKMEQRH